ncbi:MAG TPA: DUF1330 domain-containing protein [Nocardioidaceae bacterium]|nr:DUF1330 domain-containing protein [Nocardioidaceae bacterium]
MAINPTGQGLKSFLEAAPDEPVVMLNLLRFREGGRDSYERYLAHFGTFAREVGGEVIYYGEGATALVAEDGQAWDAVLLVSYPTRRAFSDMVRNPRYQEGTQLRDEALVEAVLQPTSPRGTPTEA